MLIRILDAFFFQEKENDDGFAGSTVLFEVECLRQNWTFADGERSLSKRVRRRTDEAEHIAIQYEEEERQRTSISRRHIIQSGRRRWLLEAKERERESREG